MEKYKHYDVDIMCQYAGDGQYLKKIAAEKIEYVELPIIFRQSNHIKAITYTNKDGKKVITIVAPFGGDPDPLYPREVILSMFEAPIDGDYDALYYDIIGQIHGAEPQRMRSRFSVVLSAVRKEIAENEPTANMLEMDDEEDATPVDYALIKRRLGWYGYTPDDIANITVTDVDKELLQKIIDADFI